MAEFGPIYRLSGDNPCGAPIVLSAPHGGTRLPFDFVFDSPLTRAELLATADLGTDHLIEDFGVPAIAALVARTVVDLNRPRDWLDSAVVEGVPPRYEMQIAAGYGVIPRFAARGYLVHAGKLKPVMAEALLSTYYDPYHSALAKLLGQTVDRFGWAMLIDVHSAPHSVLRDIEVQLGTQYNRTMTAGRADQIERVFQKYGLRTARDVPFAGGHITQNYGNGQIEALQIEINRAILESAQFQMQWRAAMREIINMAKPRAEAAE